MLGQARWPRPRIFGAAEAGQPAQGGKHRSKQGVHSHALKGKRRGKMGASDRSMAA